MIAWALLFSLFALSLSMVVWGALKKDRYYQYPTIAGGVWLVHMIPQAIGAVRNTSKFPPGVIQDYGVEMALLMCLLCAASGWWGYTSDHWKKIGKVNKATGQTYYSPSATFNAGVILYLIGFYGAYQLAQLCGGFIEQFTGGGHYSLEWSGLPVRYAFFSQMVYPGLLLCLLGALYRANVIKVIIILLFSLYPIAMTVFLGRRGMTAFLGIILLLSLYFVKRWAPSRFFCAAMLVTFVIFVQVGAAYRTITQYGIDFEELRQIEVRTSFKDVIAGNTYVEFDALVVGLARNNRTKTFQYGTGFYNSTVGQLIPRQLVGEEFKDSLMVSFLEGPDPYQWDIPYGSNPTGVLNAFNEFWFFGAFLYYVIGVFSRFLWERSLQPGNAKAQVWYVVWISIVIASISGCIIIIPGQMLEYYLFLGPLFWCIRRFSYNSVRNYTYSTLPNNLPFVNGDVK